MMPQGRTSNIRNCETMAETSVRSGYYYAHPPVGEEVCITGISGTFPNSENVKEFKENLFNKVHMVDQSDHEWSDFYPEIPRWSGKIPNIHKFDAGFFGVHHHHANIMDPILRLMLERAVECIFDAGLHPSELQGTRTGVFTSVLFSEPQSDLVKENRGKQFAPFVCSSESTFSHRLSYFLKLKGPSVAIDTACSSSLNALENAYRHIRDGLCDMALVASGNLLLQSAVSLSFARLGVLSPDGSCKSFDEGRNGYVRSEAVACIILQKAKDSRRIYAKIMHAKTNVDGFKQLGITYPSGRMQQRLMEEIYLECDVDPSEVCYVEAHATGTKAGDTQECRSIDRVFCTNRDTPLLVGSVKTNFGHTEAAAGLSGLMKCILAMEAGSIPPNLHFSNPNKEIEGLMEGRMKVVSEKTPLSNTNGLMAISSFGFGGANAHVLLKWNHKVKTNGGRPEDNIPRLICVSGRTHEAILSLLDAEDESLDAEYVQLLHEIFKKNIDDHNYRGYTIASKFGQIVTSCDAYSGIKPKLLLIFGDFGNSWRSVLDHLSILPRFKNTIQTIQEILINKGLNLLRILELPSLNSSVNNYLGTVVLHLGIIELFRSLNIQADSIFGHTTGKIAYAYFEGFLTLKKAVLIALQKPNEREIVKIFNGASHPMTLDNKKNLFSSINKGTVILEIGLRSSSDWTNTARNSCFDVLSFIHGKKNDGLIQFLQIVGILYQKGFNPQIQNLYPKIEYPVSRGTPTISEKIKWHHSHNWPVKRSLCKEMMRDDQKTFKVFPKEEHWNYLKGHVIDGRELFPAAGYIIMTWEAFADTKKTDKENIAVVIEDCRLTRCTILKERIDFTVAIQRRSGNFEVNEGGVDIVNGKIRLLENDDKVRQQLNLSSDDGNAEDISMDSTDFYKELRLRGYHYKDSFRLVQSCKLDAAEAYIKWTGNWVAFLDNMLQIKLLQYDTRLLFVPIGLQRIIIDPKRHLQYIDSFGEDPVIPVYNYKELGLIRCGGIEISGLVANSITRRRDIKPVLEMNKFVPNEMTTTLMESVRMNIQIVAENLRTLKINIVEVALEAGTTLLAPLMIEVFADIPQISGNIKVLTTEDLLIEDVTVKKYVKLSNETDCHLIVGTNLLKQPDALQGAISALKEDGFILSREDLDFDPLRFEHVTKLGIKTNTVHTTEKEKLFLVRKSVPSNVSDVIEISEIDEDFKWLNSLKEVIDRTKDLVMYAQNEDTNGMLGLYNCLVKEVGDTKVQCFLIYGSDAPPFDINHSFYQQQQSKNMSVNIYQNGKWGTHRYLNLPNVEVESEHMILCQTVKDDISSLEFVEGPLNNTTEIPLGKTVVHELNLSDCQKLFTKLIFTIPKGDVVFQEKLESVHGAVLSTSYIVRTSAICCSLVLLQVAYTQNTGSFVSFGSHSSTSLWMVSGHTRSPGYLSGTMLLDIFEDVYYSALNFKDIMSASGRIHADLKTAKRNETFSLGIEFVGKDTSGKRVMGLSPGAISPMIAVNKDEVVVIPDRWSMEDAATVPVLYGTILYALFKRVRIRHGESILIHAGTGGIGQAAIHFALKFDCDVFTTVGSPEKKAFLKKLFPQLKESQIGNSRNTSFELMVKRESKGKGVDLVLNSLAEEMLFASVRCLAKGGRFLELGQFDILKDNRMSLLLLEKECSFHGIFLDSLLNEANESKSNIYSLLKQGIEERLIEPITRRVFQTNEIVDAFRYMSTGQHIGKNLIQIRKEEMEWTNTVPKPVSLKGQARFWCDSVKSYIIVGGLGGFGLELANWLVLRGARKLILTSRIGLRTGYQTYNINLWRSYGVEVDISTADVSTTEGCEKLISESEILGPVDGLFNLAAVLKDSLLENQSADFFKIALIPKVKTTICLDEITRCRCPKLRHFVVFSSITCGRGNPGQTNYGLANSAMERICENRKAAGYPALAIRWGAVADVGLAAEMPKDIESDLCGTNAQSISSCLQVMDSLLTQKQATIVSSTELANAKNRIASKNIVDATANILGIRINTVSPHTTLSELGMDSLMAVEVKQILEIQFDIFISPHEIRSLTFSKLNAIQDDRCGIGKKQQISSKHELTEWNLFIQKYDDNNMIATPLLQLPSLSGDEHDAPFLFMFPGVEGCVIPMTCLASKLKAKVIGLQCCLQVPPCIFAQHVESCLAEMKKYLQPNLIVNILSFSWGTIIALEVTSLLERFGYKVNLIIIDGSPEIIPHILTKRLKNTSDTEVHIFSLSALMLNFLPSETVSKSCETLKKCTSMSERIDTFLEAMEPVKQLSQENKRILAIALFARVKDSLFYKANYGTIMATTRLFKPSIAVDQLTLPEDYNLSKICSNLENIQYFEGNHQSIMENQEMADAINVALRGKT